MVGLERYEEINPEWVGRFARSPAGAVALNFRHSFWAAARERIRRALVDAGFPLARRYTFQECGSSSLVWVDRSSGAAKVTCLCCHDRWCQACGRTKRLRMASALTALLPGKRAVHVVLTPRSNDRPLRDQVDKLRRDFAKLRRSRLWSTAVSGGLWCLELTYNHETSQWHPHLHILAHAEWMQLQDLSAAWEKCTGDSHRVHISLVEQHASAIREVSKYVGKLCHRTWEHSHDLLVCVMRALSGVRLSSTFGSWRGTALDEAPAPDPSQAWELWGSLDRLYELAKRRDPEAQDLLRQIHGQASRKPRQGPCCHAPRAP